MWWNYVARTWDEVADARSDWEADRDSGGDRFPVVASALERVPAPPLR